MGPMDLILRCREMYGHTWDPDYPLELTGMVDGLLFSGLDALTEVISNGIHYEYYNES